MYLYWRPHLKDIIYAIRIRLWHVTWRCYQSFLTSRLCLEYDMTDAECQNGTVASTINVGPTIRRMIFQSPFRGRSIFSSVVTSIRMRVFGTCLTLLSLLSDSRPRLQYYETEVECQKGLITREVYAKYMYSCYQRSTLRPRYDGWRHFFYFWVAFK